MSKTLVISPLQAQLKSGSDVFTKMDPYWIVTLGSFRHKGKVCKSGGKNPSWDDSVTIKVTNETSFYVELKDKDIISDDTIGVCEVPIQEIITQGKVDKWYDIYAKQKLKGSILLSIAAYPDDQGGNSTKTQATQQQAYPTFPTQQYGGVPQTGYPQQIYAQPQTGGIPQQIYTQPQGYPSQGGYPQGTYQPTGYSHTQVGYPQTQQHSGQPGTVQTTTYGQPQVLPQQGYGTGQVYTTGGTNMNVGHHPGHHHSGDSTFFISTSLYWLLLEHKKHKKDKKDKKEKKEKKDKENKKNKAKESKIEEADKKEKDKPKNNKNKKEKENKKESSKVEIKEEKASEEPKKEENKPKEKETKLKKEKEVKEKSQAKPETTKETNKKSVESGSDDASDSESN